MDLEEENEKLREEVKELERRIENLTTAIKDAVYNLNY
jgi:cell division protein FtsB